MPRRILILPVALIAVALAAWLTVPTVMRWLAPASVVDIKLLRLDMTHEAVRDALGPPASRGLGSWTYGPPGELADRGVTIFFDADSRESGWADLDTGANVGHLPSGAPASRAGSVAVGDDGEVTRGQEDRTPRVHRAHRHW